MVSCCTQSWTPGTGRTLTQSLARLRSSNNFLCGRGISAPTAAGRRGHDFFNVQRSTLNAQRPIQRLKRSALDVGRWAFAFLRRVKGAWWPSRSCDDRVRLLPSSAFNLFNAQRSTLNTQRPIQGLKHWALDVERWEFSFSRRVKGAWWPSRSSKPSLTGNGQGRFDSYPLRHAIFEFRFSIFDFRIVAAAVPGGRKGGDEH